jgi:hypothetical protein
MRTGQHLVSENRSAVSAASQGATPREGALVWNRATACEAAADASSAFRQWVPQQWLDFFFKFYEDRAKYPASLTENVARVLYECERKRGEIANSVMSAATGREITGCTMEPWEECKDTFLSDARAVLSALSKATGTAPGSPVVTP